MNTYLHALGWASAILIVAAAGIWGVIEGDTMTTLLIVLPAAAWIALSRRSHCPVPREG
jgi:hypothetical protein